MNPERSTARAALDHIDALKSELRERDRVIAELRNEKRSKMRARGGEAMKTAGRFLRAVLDSPFPLLFGVFGAIGLIAFLVVLFEPNDEYIAKGTVAKITPGSKDTVRTDGNGKIVNSYDIKYVIIYADRDGKRELKISSGDLRSDSTCEVRARKDIDMYTHKLIHEEEQIYRGCRVDVYYKMGRWFNDRSWCTPFIDASACKKPDAPAIKKNDTSASSNTQKPVENELPRDIHKKPAVFTNEE